MEKLLIYDPEDKYGRHFFRSDEIFGQEKVADDYEWSPEVKDIVSKIKPDPKYVTVLLNAMGASEFYGSNSKGDAFKESELMDSYHTFEQLANVFKFHDNKDPKKAFGKVLASIYNPRMHRVELIIRVDREKAPDIANRIDKGEFPSCSMGCLKKGTPVLLPDGTRKLIEDIEVGDSVLTHNGNSKKVTSLHRRTYNGDLYCIKPYAGNSIYVTDEHPFFVVKRKKCTYQDGKAHPFRWKKNVSSDDAEWICSKHLEFGDFLLTPAFKGKEVDNSINEDVARLLGYYLADGYPIGGKNVYGFGICTGSHEKEIHKDIRRVLSNLGIRKKEKRNIRNAYYFNCYGKKYAELLYKLAGKGAHDKIIDSSVMSWPVDLQKHFLSTYVNGDGCQSFGRYSKGNVTISTCNKKLANQIVYLANRIGVIASISTVIHKAGSGFNHHDTTEHIIYFERKFSNIISKTCQKVKPIEINGTGGRRKLIDGYIFTPIEEISKIENISIPVFNFEVEGDNSYVVDKFAVHNCKVSYDQCSICLKKNKTISSYCEELKNHMNEILADGRQVYADNIKPRFFDISFVPVGADRTARVLRKVASSNVPSAMLMEAYKKVDKRKSAKLAATFNWGKLEMYEKPLVTPSKLDKDAMWQLVSSYIKLGIMPNLKEFCGLAKRAGLEENDSIDLDLVSEVEFPKMAMLMPGRSAFSPYLENRLVDAASKYAIDPNGARISLISKGSTFLIKRDPESPWSGIREKSASYERLKADEVIYANMFSKFSDDAFEYLSDKVDEVGLSYVSYRISPDMDKSSLNPQDQLGMEKFASSLGDEAILSDLSEPYKREVVCRIGTML